MGIWDWIKKLLGLGPVVISEVKPLIADGEAVVASLAELVSDLKGSRFGEVIEDAKLLVEDVKVFAAEVEKIVNELQAAGKI